LIYETSFWDSVSPEIAKIRRSHGGVPDFEGFSDPCL
jgi:hypothetical protein